MRVRIHPIKSHFSVSSLSISADILRTGFTSAYDWDLDQGFRINGAKIDINMKKINPNP